jgi:NAD(P)-dependent dehydrogenase (short-subunit alcohol dehydrogenase family)
MNMNHAKQQKYILITGANRGIGLEFARQYRDSGHYVFATCRNPDTATELQDLFQGRNTGSIHALDIANTNQIRSLADELLGQPLDIIVSNAGIYGPSNTDIGSEDMDDDIWIQALKTNAIGPFRLLEAFLPHLKKGQDKKIAFITSRMGSIGDNGYGRGYVYRSSKAAMNAIGRSVAIDLEKEDIHSLLLHPGFVKTDMTNHNGTVMANDSVLAMRRLIEQLDHDTNGKFLHMDGSELPW